MARLLTPHNTGMCNVSKHTAAHRRGELRTDLAGPAKPHSPADLQIAAIALITQCDRVPAHHGFVDRRSGRLGRGKRETGTRWRSAANTLRHLAWRHAQRTIQPDGFAMQHLVLDDV